MGSKGFCSPNYMRRALIRHCARLRCRPSLDAMELFYFVWSTVGRAVVLLHASRESQMGGNSRRVLRASLPARRRPVLRRCAQRYSDFHSGQSVANAAAHGRNAVNTAASLSFGRPSICPLLKRAISSSRIVLRTGNRPILPFKSAPSTIPLLPPCRARAGHIHWR